MHPPIFSEVHRPERLPGTIWGISTFFNPAGYTTKLENYHLFRERAARQGLKLLTVEAAYEDQPFCLKEKDADILVQVRTHAAVWQKERLINLGVSHLPSDCDKVIWIDADALVEDDDWITDTASLLEEYVIVQPYSAVVRLERGERSPIASADLPPGWLNHQRQPSFVFTSRFGWDFHEWNWGAPGFIWAARRWFLERHGLYDRFILGENDSIFAYALVGSEFEPKYRSSLPQSYQKWARALQEDVRGSIGLREGVGFHLWHGSISQRYYAERSMVLDSFDPDFDLTVSAQGCLEWTPRNPGLAKRVCEYFLMRNEDGTTPVSLAEEKILTLEKEICERHREIHRLNRLLGKMLPDDTSAQRGTSSRLLIADIRIPEQLPGSTWGVTAYFNPAQYATKLENFRRFREGMSRQGLRLLVVELAFGSAPFTLTKDDTDILMQLRSDSVLWQKERLITEGICHLPPECDKVIWIDGDILFENEFWVSETAALLSEYIVVQPFEAACRLQRGEFSPISTDHFPLGDREHQRHLSFAYTSRYGWEPEEWNWGKPGLVWAARRALIARHGLYDRFVVGGGDSHIANAFIGRESMPKNLPLLRSHFRRWTQGISTDAQGSLGMGNGTVFHLWHGHVPQRYYQERNSILRSFDPAKDVSIDEHGVLQWSGGNPLLEKEVHDYFWLRNEDDCTPRSVAEEKMLSLDREVQRCNREILGLRRCLTLTPSCT
ncbi:MAG: hypothetical protein PHH13_01270 [Candidatus Peribacteraceae bacterium]|nr:hypothetical protein [Candidatus Peribacteraceae bacterium]